MNFEVSTKLMPSCSGKSAQNKAREKLKSPASERGRWETRLLAERNIEHTQVPGPPALVERALWAACLEQRAVMFHWQQLVGEAGQAWKFPLFFL